MADPELDPKAVRPPRTGRAPRARRFRSGYEVGVPVLLGVILLLLVALIVLAVVVLFRLSLF